MEQPAAQRLNKPDPGRERATPHPSQDAGFDFTPVLEDFPEPVILTNRNLRIKSWNRAAEALYGWPSREAEGKNLNELLRAEYAERTFDEAVSDLLRAGRIELEATHRSRDGRELFVVSNAFLLTSGNRDVSGMLLVVRDRTALKVMEAELASRAEEHRQLVRRAEELERQSTEMAVRMGSMNGFMADVSHELKTPLSLLFVNIQMLEYRIRDADGELRDRLMRTADEMRLNAYRLLRLVTNLVDLARAEGGGMSAHFASLDIVHLVGSLTQAVQRHTRHAGVEIAFVSDRPARHMPVDRDKTEKILLNLLSNAVRHTGRGGHILVSLKNGPDSATLTVRDDGEGIPESHIENLFNRFAQENAARPGGGAGLGLPLTRALAELLGGSVTVSSLAGRGSEFTVTLPVQPAGFRSGPAETEALPLNRKVEMEFSSLAAPAAQEPAN